MDLRGQVYTMEPTPLSPIDCARDMETRPKLSSWIVFLSFLVAQKVWSGDAELAPVPQVGGS